jgi:acetyltransferase-like isoleucine patch superfamily enzyme
LAAVYLLPVLVYRCFVVLYPLELGLSNMTGQRFSPWWASHQIQLLYTAMPVLEAMLRMIPGLYSAWLRLWGARIGAAVYWTPRMEMHDRGLLRIGDNVIFGHKVELYGHMVTPKRTRLLLYTGLVTVGAGAFVGAGSRLAPGVVVGPGAVVPILTDLHMNARFPKEELDAPRPA